MDDQKFLEKLKNKKMRELEEILNAHFCAPRWKQVAIRRAMARIEPRPQSWVLGIGEYKSCMHLMGDEASRVLIEQAIERTENEVCEPPTFVGETKQSG